MAFYLSTVILLYICFTTDVVIFRKFPRFPQERRSDLPYSGTTEEVLPIHAFGDESILKFPS